MLFISCNQKGAGRSQGMKITCWKNFIIEFSMKTFSVNSQQGKDLKSVQA